VLIKEEDVFGVDEKYSKKKEEQFVFRVVEKLKLNSVALVRERTMQTDRVAEDEEN
jgi:hypothetical protein